MSRDILDSVLERGSPSRAPPQRAVGRHHRRQPTCSSAATGYTGEPLCFELFVPPEQRRRPLGSSRRERSRSLWPRRAGHPCAWKPDCRCTATSWASIPRAGDTVCCRRPLAAFAVSFSPRQGRLRRPRRRCSASTPPTGASWPATTPSWPTCPGMTRPVASPAGAWPGPDLAVCRDGPAGGLGDERHHGALLEDRGRGPRHSLHRRARPALHLPRAPRQRRGRGRPAHHRHPRQAGGGRGGAVPPAERRPAVRPADRLRRSADARPLAVDGRRAGPRRQAAATGSREHRLAAAGVHQPHPLGDDAPRRWCGCSR